MTTTCAAEGSRVVFVHARPGLARLREGDAEGAVRCALAALEGVLPPPYRAAAVRREGDVWAVGAAAIEVADLPADIEGEELTLTVTHEGEHELTVDGRPGVAGVHELAERVRGGHDAFVLRALRIEGSLWEIEVDPL